MTIVLLCAFSFFAGLIDARQPVLPKLAKDRIVITDNGEIAGDGEPHFGRDADRLKCHQVRPAKKRIRPILATQQLSHSHLHIAQHLRRAQNIHLRAKALLRHLQPITQFALIDHR